MPSPSDVAAEQAAVLAARADHTRFANIYQEHVEVVRDFVEAGRHDPEDTDDLVAATFTRALEHIDEWLPSADRPIAWYLKRYARFEMAQVAVSTQPRHSNVPRACLDWNDSPQWEIADLIASLPVSFRQVIYAMYFEDKSVPQIAAEFHRNVTWVQKNRLCALIQLRSSLTLPPPYRPFTSSEPIRTVVPVD